MVFGLVGDVIFHACKADRTGFFIKRSRRMASRYLDRHHFRLGFWRKLAEKSPRAGLVCNDLTGVGTQVDWAWQQVVDCISE